MAAAPVELGGLVETAPIPGGLGGRRDTGRRAHRHEHGLLVDGKKGSIVLPYATTTVSTSYPPVPFGPRNRVPDHSESWWFSGGATQWRTTWVRRDSPLGALCIEATRIGTAVRLPLARQALDAGRSLGGATVRVDAWGVTPYRWGPIPWRAVRRIRLENDSVLLDVDGQAGAIIVGEGMNDVDDLAVIVALVAERAGR